MFHQSSVVGPIVPVVVLILRVAIPLGLPGRTRSVVALGSRVEMVIDGGVLLPVPSTVVDMTGDEPVLIREGKGDVETLELF